MTKHFCDMCGKEMPSAIQENVRIAMKARYREEGKKEFVYSWKNFYHDICQECAEKLEAIITGGDVNGKEQKE